MQRREVRRHRVAAPRAHVVRYILQTLRELRREDGVAHGNADGAAERTEEGEDGGADGHVLDRHRGLEGDERGLEEAADTETGDEDDKLLLCDARVLLHHDHETLDKRLVHGYKEFYQKTHKSESHEGPSEPHDWPVLSGLGDDDAANDRSDGGTDRQWHLPHTRHRRARAQDLEIQRHVVRRPEERHRVEERRNEDKSGGACLEQAGRQDRLPLCEGFEHIGCDDQYSAENEGCNRLRSCPLLLRALRLLEAKQDEHDARGKDEEPDKVEMFGELAERAPLRLVEVQEEKQH